MGGEGDEYPEETVWTDVAIYVLIMVVYYWRLNLHIRDVYRTGSNQQLQRIVGTLGNVVWK